MRRVALLLSSAVLGCTAFTAVATSAQPIATVETDAGSVAIEEIATGLDHPWAIAFLPDGGALVTERAGQLRRLDADGELTEPLEGVPEVYARGQGGLLDVALDPDFADNSRVYLSFAEPGDNGASTAVGRGRLAGDRVDDFEVLFRQEPKHSSSRHFGGRIAFAPDGTLFLTTGERGQLDPAQDLGDHVGTIVRIHPDGSIPQDNPFVDQADARDEIWSYGHRNVEAAAFHPETNELWVAEMGPYGGDELNQPAGGRNYGWPVVSWGRHYNGTDIPDPPTQPEFADAAMHWTPVISPSGMTFYTGAQFPEWRGSALIGSLSDQAMVRVEIEDGTAREAERLPLNQRIREVAQAPDDTIYVLTDADDGSIWRLAPGD
ncbi:MAG: PQQ-dependent sugar dehydrogenase [Halofilum sp. (in: g-proteobacteria)]